MKPLLTLVTAIALLVAPTSRAAAQLLTDAPIVYGHHHLAVSDIEAHKKFWAGTLGGVAMKSKGGTDFIMFPNVLVFLRAQAPTGPTKGTTVNHLGFSVPDLRAVLDRVKANGYRIVTAQEAPAGVSVSNDIAATGEGIAFVLGPDDVKVELVQVKAQAAPIMYHHTHFFGPDPEAMRAWYAKVFGATPRPGPNPTIISAALPAGVLNFSTAPDAVVPTKGRALDHVGFEVKNLEAFCRRLEAEGIKLDVTYRYAANLGLGVAFITDPWGTSIELNEGMTQFR